MAPLADTCFSTPRHFSTLDEVLMVVRSLFLSSECMQRSRSVSALVQLANDGNWIGLRVEDGAVWTGGGNIWSEAANPIWLARISKQSLLHCHCSSSSSHSMHLPSVGLLCNASKYHTMQLRERLNAFLSCSNNASYADALRMQHPSALRCQSQLQRMAEAELKCSKRICNSVSLISLKLIFCFCFMIW